MAALLLVGSTSLKAQTAEDPFPDVNSTKYQGYMTLTATVKQSETTVLDGIVAIYCGDEMRGKARIGNGAGDPHLAYISVYGENSGDVLYVKVFANGFVYELHPGDLTYEWQGNKGSYSNPYVITLPPVVTLLDRDTDAAVGQKNADIVAASAGTVCDVLLNGRTLYKDGSWNTLCLPFSLTAEQIASSSLAGCTLMELDVTGTYDTDKHTGYDAESHTLYLYFTTASAITAGKPYLIKWESGDEIVTPRFPSVTLASALTDVASTDGKVVFKGTYTTRNFDATNKDILFLGSGNNLYYPENGACIGSQRAYFELNTASAAALRHMVLSFGDGTTMIEDTFSFAESVEETWYDLHGRLLNGRPTTRGLYIMNGKKIAIE